MTDAKRLGAAFRAGLFFSRGRNVAQDAAKWITVHPNGKGLTKTGEKAKGQPVLIDGETGEVLGGMGGKFTGRHISAVPKRGKEEQHGAQLAIEFYKNREKIEAARKAKEQQKKTPTQIVPYFTDGAKQLVAYYKARLSAFDFEKEKQKNINHGSSPETAESLARRSKMWLENDLNRAEKKLANAGTYDAELAQVMGELKNAEFDKNGSAVKKHERFLSSVKKLEKFDLKKEADKIQKKYGLSRKDAEETAQFNRFDLADRILKTGRLLKETLMIEKGQADLRRKQTERENKLIAEKNGTRSYSSGELGQKIKAIFESNKGNITESTAQKAGEIAFDGLTKLSVMSSLAAIQTELNTAVSARNEAQTNLYYQPYEAREEARNKISSLKEKEREIRQRIDKVQAESVKAVSDYVASIRPRNDLSDERMLEGFSNPSRNSVNPTLIEAQRCFPKEWAEAFLSRGKIVSKKVSRGYFLNGNGELDTVAISGEGTEALRCAIHELGHRLEVTNPLVRRLEQQFYERRTANEKLETLRRITGNSAYSTKEKARKDKFLDPYMGKDYGGSAYELVSVGLEMLYTKPHELIKDPDYAKFILGIVALT